jgi:DNA-binding response OmpR family regulator
VARGVRHDERVIGRAGNAEEGGPAPARLRALVVDDEEPLVRLVGSYLEREGFEVLRAGDGERAVELAREGRPDVIVLDLMLPGIDGLEACRRIRAFSDAYIVMLTARAEEIDKVVGLSTGADDYVTKPFSPRELVARIRAMLRRPRAGADAHDRPVRRFGDLTLDPAAREVLLGGRPVALTRLEFDLLEALSERPRVVFTRAQLLERVWGPGWFGDDHVIDVHIANLRRKLGDSPGSPRFVETLRGVGYRMGAGT